MKKIIISLLIFNSFIFAKMILDISNNEKNRITSILSDIQNVKPSVVDALLNADETQDGTGSAIWEDSKYRYIFKIVRDKGIGIFIITKIYNKEHPFIKSLNIKDGTVLLVDGNDENKLIWSNIVTVDYSIFNINNTNTVDVTTYGTNTTDNLSFFLEDCLDKSILSKSINKFRKTTKFQCTPSYTAGYKYGEITNVDSDEIIKKFNLFINDNSDSSYDYLHGIDVSHHQGYIDWSLMQNNNNIRFAFIKTTEGYGSSTSSEDTLIQNFIVSSRFRENINNALSNNIFSGLYHFMRPDLNPGLQGAENEAKTFVRFAKPYYDTYKMLPPVIDIENPPCKEPCPNYKTLKELFSANTLSLWVKKWLEVVEEEMGIEPIVYTYGGYNSYLVGLNNYDLWVARYPYNDGSFRPLNEHDEEFKPTDANWANSTTPWKDWIMWQYTSQGGDYVNGISGSKLDRNVYRGTLNALKQWAESKRH